MKKIIERFDKLTDPHRQWGNLRHKLVDVVSSMVAKRQIMLGQLKTEEKSNEITAIPEHIDIIDIEGSTVTIDAMGRQKQIASKIRGKGAEYVLRLKGNQPSLLSDVQLHFERECPEAGILPRDRCRVAGSV